MNTSNASLALSTTAIKINQATMVTSLYEPSFSVRARSRSAYGVGGGGLFRGVIERLSKAASKLRH
jgi:hypothetical protein